jgi:hypothetical protein
MNVTVSSISTFTVVPTPFSLAVEVTFKPLTLSSGFGLFSVVSLEVIVVTPISDLRAYSSRLTFFLVAVISPFVF